MTNPEAPEDEGIVSNEDAKRHAFTALAAAQGEFPILERIKKAHNSMYAPYEELRRCVQPILARHGLSIIFSASVREGNIRIIGCLQHKGGYSWLSEVELPLDSSGGKNAVQGTGSTISYGRRYVAMMLLDLAAKDEDTDGASATTPLSEEQIAALKTKVTQSGRDEGRFLSMAKVASWEEIPASSFSALDGILNAAIARGRG